MRAKAFKLTALTTFFACKYVASFKGLQKSLFNKDRPISQSKNEDAGCLRNRQRTKNSLISDGCLIEGTVINSVLSRGVRVAKGAVVENSIIMQDAFVGEDVKLNCVIMDKKAVVTPKKSLSGDESYPLYVGKDIII